MASLVRPGAIDMLEEAVHTLRAGRLTAVVYHWIGSVPFAVGLLVFWHDMTRTGTPESACAVESLALAILLLWMNCWRAVFAGRVERQLGSRPANAWTGLRVWHLISSQAFLGGSKLLAMPVAFAIMLPLAWTTAFYRSAATLGGRDDLDWTQLMARARKLAGFEQRQGWAILGLLTILFIVLWLNLALLLAILPQLVRIVTGYESAFSRSGIFLVSNSLFWMAALAVAWLAFDPYVQAVYAVRCFHLESRETGEDLRASLRLIEKAAAILLVTMALCGASPAARAAEIRATDLDHAIRQSLQSPEYAWHSAPAAPPRAGRAPWLIAVTDRLIASVREGLRGVGNLVDRFIDWLREKLNRPSRMDTAAPPSTALHWSIYALIAVLLALGGLVAWRLRRLRAAKPLRLVAGMTAAVSLEDEDLLADRLPEDRWMALADECARQGDFRSALRALYLANLAWLGHAEWIGIHTGKTNREYELELRRKARALPDACAIFASNILSYERAWYGMHDVSAADAETFRAQVRQMQSAMAQGKRAA